MSKSGRREGGHTWTLQDAKNKLSEVVNAAVRGEPQIVTRRGVETAVIISHDEFGRVSGRPPNDPSLADRMLAVPTRAEAEEESSTRSGDRELLLAEVAAIQQFVAELPDRDPRSAEEILGYDDLGLPR